MTQSSPRQRDALAAYRGRLEVRRSGEPAPMDEARS